MGLLCTAGRPTSPKVRGQRLAAVTAHDLRPDWPHKVEGQRRWHHQLDNRRTDACAATENGCQQLRGWTSGGPRPSRTPSLAPRRTTTARRALPKTIYMCVRRQLRIYKLWVWVSRIAFGVRCVSAQPQTEGRWPRGGFPARGVPVYITLNRETRPECCSRAQVCVIPLFAPLDHSWSSASTWRRYSRRSS